MEEVKLNWKQDDMLEIVLKEPDDFMASTPIEDKPEPPTHAEEG